MAGRRLERVTLVPMFLTAIALKWLSVWVVLLFISLSFGPTPAQSAAIAFFVAVASLAADRAIPFRVQGWTRWAVDGGLAALGIYMVQFLWPHAGISVPMAVFAGAVVGALEIPLHFFLASRFGLRRPDDDRDGIR